jgi:signal peptidase I
MLQGLHSGDRVLVNPWAYSLGIPRRGDVVAVSAPSGPGGDAVKRVIGLPGDQIEIRPAVPGGPPAVFIRPAGAGGWDRLAEPYLGSAGAAWLRCCDAAGRATQRPRPFTVPAGRYFVLGDNRNVSYDSRDYGPVTLSEIQGKVVWLVLPLQRFGAIMARPSLTPAHI